MKKRRHRHSKPRNPSTSVTPLTSQQLIADAPPAAALGEPRRQQLTWSNVFGATFWAFAGIAALAGAVCWYVKGPQVFHESLRSDVDLLLFILPRFGAGMLIAAFVQSLLPRDRVAQYVSDGAGVKAVGIATVVGGLTPGGPMTSFPLVRALQDAGTGRSALVAYVTSWSTMGFQRILNWELPLLGPEFTLMRLVASLPLPLIAGMTARFLPQPPARSDEETQRVR